MQQEKKANRLEAMRHSAAHVMAEAVQALFPDVKFGIGPATEDGFYYDFELPRPLTPDDLSVVEEKMRGSIAADAPFAKQEVTKEAARPIFHSQPYKLELIDELDDETVTIYRQGSFTDLCRGPHLASTGELKAFKLLSIAGAYWRGDERRPMLQRIYGTAFETEAELADHLNKLEEAARRDHRKLGRELDLFTIHEGVGAGLVLWHPGGGRVRVLIEDYWRKLHYEGGYEIIFTPHIGRAQLWERSGHLDFYRDGMYSPMDIEGQDYYVKPMNCPFHIMIYKSQTRSYRDLPLRWAELGTVYRYERSGTLRGLMRVRGFTQDDAHIFCAPEQVEGEILRVLDFSLNLLRGFGFEEFKFELSVRDPGTPEKYAGDDVMWEQAEASLVAALEARNLPYERIEGEAVFYGPKIDIKIKDALERMWQCTTIQFDFNLPERFDMAYIGEDGKGHWPYMIHRTLLGSMERFLGILVEHYGGAFPVWLAPVQVKVIPIADRHLDYAQQIGSQLRDEGLRVEVDDRKERMNLKIREAQLAKVPYMLITGDSEVQDSTVTLRLRSGENLKGESLEVFKDRVRNVIMSKRGL
ncbi:threonine--tRNA ligase [Dehalococcoidia bacterium]|nr:threonine--tRNA ligase [Dehalococcoidia bacterium]MCL0090760.1 threonine--tRNA ligase [Dehalococcoidia bacterium]MCL0103639.1 threonine--tRNA ligase [Dehalococcoidia bacterium]